MVFSLVLKIIVLVLWTAFAGWVGYKWGINHKDVKNTLTDMKDSANEELDKVKDKINK
jgi:hypothetical protein